MCVRVCRCLGIAGVLIQYINSLNVSRTRRLTGLGLMGLRFRQGPTHPSLMLYNRSPQRDREKGFD